MLQAVCRQVRTLPLLLALVGASLAALPPETYQLAQDWLVEPANFKATARISADGETLTLDNGLVRRVIRLKSGCATVAVDDHMTGRSLLRAVRPEGTVTINGREHAIGGLVGQPNQAYLTPEWLAAMRADPAALRLIKVELGQPRERMAWKRERSHETGAVWPPKGVYARLDFEPADATPTKPSFVVSVHFELYDGIPVWSKWITVQNNSSETLTVDRFNSELLAVVEASNHVEHRPPLPLPEPNCLEAETDQAFGSFNVEQANRHAVRWEADPSFTTQVNYLLKSPCLLRIGPFRGPAQEIAPGGTFESFRAFVLVQDSTEQERRGLARRKLYRTLAPWITENPLMHHLLANDPKRVRQAIDEAAEVGFEMVILSFGSGFNAENEQPDYLATWRDVAAYARSKGIDIGSYSLLSSRRVGGGNDVVPAPGESTTFGNAPALTSTWGTDYFRKIRQLHAVTGFKVFEHDGSYPGDWDVTARPPLQRGLDDSQWAQWRIIDSLYRWCRGEGIYLNVPDYYFLGGSNKCGMGYREVNWSLPRAQQVIHTRQNIYDGTWTRTPSMGWMFVPLSQYQGGGAAATIEPLDTHLDHYRRMMVSNLAYGVQACYRGPRLYDTPRTREMVRETVAWYKRHRAILESDVVHLRRADGLDWDGAVHVNPALPERGMLVAFNPTTQPIEREILVPLHYAGLTDACVAQLGEEGSKQSLKLDSQRRARVRVTIPAEGHATVVFRAP